MLQKNVDVNSKYAIGIDLGTTNSALAFLDLHSTKSSIEQFSIPQLVKTKLYGSSPLLPSFIYLATTEEGQEEENKAR